MVTDGRRQFFLRQSHQERHHASVFHRVVLCTTPRGAGTVPAGLRNYRARLEQASRRNDIVETLVGQQMVLEGFGEVILNRMDKKFDQRRIGFKKIRKTLLAQEQGHQAFGHRMLRHLVESGEVELKKVHELISEYLVFIDHLLVELEPVFNTVGADPACYRRTLQQRLCNW